MSKRNYNVYIDDECYERLTKEEALIIFNRTIKNYLIDNSNFKTLVTYDENEDEHNLFIY